MQDPQFQEYPSAQDSDERTSSSSNSSQTKASPLEQGPKPPSKYSSCMCCFSPEKIRNASDAEKGVMAGILAGAGICAYIFIGILSPFLLVLFLVAVVLFLASCCCGCFCCGKLFNEQFIQQLAARYVTTCRCCFCCCMEPEDIEKMREDAGLPV